MMSRVSYVLFIEEVIGRCSSKLVFLKISQILQEKTLAWSLFLIKLQALRPETFLKKTPTKVFYCEICESFKNTFFYRKPPVSVFKDIPKLIKKS